MDEHTSTIPRRTSGLARRASDGTRHPPFGRRKDATEPPAEIALSPLDYDADHLEAEPG